MIGGGGCAGGGVPLGAVPALSWCGEVSLGGKHIIILNPPLVFSACGHIVPPKSLLPIVGLTLHLGIRVKVNPKGYSSGMLLLSLINDLVCVCVFVYLYLYIYYMYI